MNRIDAFLAHTEHAYLGRLYARLKKADIAFCLDFLKETRDLDAGEFEFRVNRMFLDKPDKPKNSGIIQELLSCANKSNPSPAQLERQRHRDQGKYAAVNPCYACGKSAGVDYYSHPLTDCGDWGDLALVLCKKCGEATAEMTRPEEFEKYKSQFGDAADEAWAKVRR